MQGLIWGYHSPPPTVFQLPSIIWVCQLLLKSVDLEPEACIISNLTVMSVVPLLPHCFQNIRWKKNYWSSFGNAKRNTMLYIHVCVITALIGPWAFVIHECLEYYLILEMLLVIMSNSTVPASFLRGGEEPSRLQVFNNKVQSLEEMSNRGCDHLL